MRRLPAALALVGGVLLALGAVLDWSGVDYSSRLDRQITGASASAALVAGAWLLRRPSHIARALALVAGVVAANMAVVNILDVSGHRHEYASRPEASVGIGLWLLLTGALLSLASGLVGLVYRPAARPAP